LLAGVATLGGALLFMDLGLQAVRGIGRGYFVVAGIMALCMPALPAAVWFKGAIAGRAASVLAGVGTAAVGVGAAMWLAAFVMLFSTPQAAFTQHLTPGGSLLMAIGMLFVGAGALLARRLDGFARFTPLAVGLYFPLQLIAQILFFLGGRDGSPGPNGLLLGAWGLVWIMAAVSVAQNRVR
jgi:hypothetical protein